MPERRGAEREQLRTAIEEKVFIPREQAQSLHRNGNPTQWIFDFRPLLLSSEHLDTVCNLFWEQLAEDYPYQAGGLETAAIALVAGMVMKGKERDKKITGFYVRKSRRKDGFQKHIEGSLSDRPIILFDDALNSGRSFMRQIAAIESEGKRVHAVCVIIRYRDVSFYKDLHDRGIKIYSLFTLEDFPRTGGLVKTRAIPEVAPMQQPFSINWKFESPNPSYFLIRPKSAPILDAERIYFGSDNGTMWALNQRDGSIAWRHRVLYTGKKGISSSPALSRGTLYFGAYDGNFYALDAATGDKKWINFEADWIGSSPCVAEDLDLVYVGLEFGLWKKQGGIAAFDCKTGEKKWWQPIETMVHSSPAYSKKYEIVVVGSTHGHVYAFRARDGKPLWQITTGGAVRAGFAFDETRGYVCFGSEDKCIYIARIKDGSIAHTIETLEPIYSTPAVHNGRLYFGVLDKRVFCIDLDSGSVLWEHWAHSRIFSTPEYIDGAIYIGSNDGRLYVLDAETGQERAYFQATERIVNKIAYDAVSQRLFVPTYANEIYSLTRRDIDSL